MYQNCIHKFAVVEKHDYNIEQDRGALRCTTTIKKKEN